jgi:hypothetical protein
MHSRQRTMGRATVQRTATHAENGQITPGIDQSALASGRPHCLDSAIDGVSFRYPPEIDSDWGARAHLQAIQQLNVGHPSRRQIQARVEGAL